MKRIISSLSFLLLATYLFAQAPEKLSYQAVIRNANGDLVKNSNVGIRIQILQSSEFGAAVYVETQQATTNENGLTTIEIGGGTVVTGGFDSINWSAGPYYIKSEIDVTGGTNYTITGISQLLSVPYALYAKTAIIPENVVRSSAPAKAGDLLLYNGNAWTSLPAGNEGQVLTMMNGMPSWKDLLTGNELIALHNPILKIIFNDRTGNHNMHITSDGNYYYTCNGGNYTIGRINKYTLSGDSVTSYPIALDMRGLMYNKADGNLYASGFESNFGSNIYKITDLATGSFKNIYPNLYDNGQSTVAMSDDGQYFYAFNAGTLKQYKFSDGSLVNTINGLNYGNGNGCDGNVAVGPDYIYTWDSSTGTVYVYDLAGTYVKSLTLTNGNYGYSLSYVNGYLFAARDGSYNAGTWYGYNIRRNVTGTAIIDKKTAVSDKKKAVDVHDTTQK